MPVRVVLIREALEDLERCFGTGYQDQFLAKLVRLEDVGRAAGEPLGKGLMGWRKIVVGDRDWRIIFQSDEADTLATVLVIANRADEECYCSAERRLADMKGPPETVSLAAALSLLLQSRKRRERRRRR